MSTKKTFSTETSERYSRALFDVSKESNEIEKVEADVKIFQSIFDTNVEFLRMAFWQILIISGPLLAVALAIGLVIGILQAATSIQEMTLTFVPKLILVVVAFGLLANFMMVQLTDYFSFIFDQVAQSA